MASSHAFGVIILFIVAGIVGFVLNLLTEIPYVGWVLWIILIPILIIFEARYICRIYESSGET